MAQTYYSHHCKKEVKTYNYHGLYFYTLKNYPQHNSKELTMLIQSLKLSNCGLLMNNTMHEIFNKFNY